MRRIQISNLLPALVASLALLCGAVPAAAAEKYAAVVVDVKSGETLFARYADAQRYPASLTKMMTLYVLFEDLDSGRFSLASKFSVSAKAAAQAPSKLGLKAGGTIKVEDAILGLTTKSANDAAVVVAENVSGSVSGFAARMNKTAKALGMHSTTFRNPNGLPDPGQTTTARDLVRLATALQDRFPTYYKYFGARSFTYAGKRHRNHNRLLGSVEGVDGIKTGYTRASGFNLVSNVRRGDRHIVAVVLGGKTAASRDAHMRELIGKYLPDAARGERSAPLLVADTSADDGSTPRLPRPRPMRETEAPLAFASPEHTPDIVAAAMAESAVAEGDQAGMSVDAGISVDDPIADRISTANEVAELAYLTPEKKDGDSLARLTEIAKLRAGTTDMVAAPARVSVADNASEAGWHIQIGAVPTEAGAQKLIEKAQGSAKRTLAARQPLTQEVVRNGTTLYRARFAGFVDKDQARKACAQLKSKSIACLAVPN